MKRLLLSPSVLVLVLIVPSVLAISQFPEQGQGWELENIVVSAWHFNDTSPTTTTDSYGTQNGTCASECPDVTTSCPSGISTCFSFEASNNDYINITSNALYQFNDSHVICSYVILNNSWSTQAWFASFKGKSASSASGWFWGAQGTDKYAGRTYDNGQVEYQNSSANYGQWNSYCYYHNTEASLGILYLNGVQLANASESTGYDASDQPLMTVGSGWDSGTQDTTLHMTGAMSELIIFRSPNQSAMYQAIQEHATGNYTISGGAPDTTPEAVQNTTFPSVMFEDLDFALNMTCTDSEDDGLSAYVLANVNGSDYLTIQKFSVLNNTETTTYNLTAGNFTFNANLSYEYLCSDNNSNTSWYNTSQILVLPQNFPPVINHTSLFVNATYNLTNDTVVEYHTSTFRFNLSVTDGTGVNYAEHNISCSNTTVLYATGNATGITEVNITFTNFTDFSCNPFLITSYANDEYGKETFLNTKFNVTDSGNPNQVGIINTSATINTTANFNVTFTDSNFYGYNVTCDNGFAQSVTGLNVQSYEDAFSINITSNPVICNWRFCDGHTNEELKKQWLVQRRINENNNSEIAFDINGHRPIIELASEDATLTYLKQKDRYSFTVTNDRPTKEKRTYTLRYYASNSSHYIIDNKYPGWIADPSSELWFDLAGVDAELQVFRIKPGIWEFTITSDEKEMTFNSIGEFNCVNVSQQINGTATELNVPWQGVLENLRCHDDTTADVLLNALIFFILIIIFIVNIVWIKIPFVDIIIGLAMFFYSLMFMGCHQMTGVVLAVVSIGMMLYGFFNRTV